MFSVLPKLIVKIFLASFCLWILLSTIVPQLLTKFVEPQVHNLPFTVPAYPQTSLTSPSPLPSNLHNSTIYFVIAHPDDEVMFFSPSFVELARPKYNNRLKLISFSRGDAAGSSMGDIRAQELMSSARILGIAAEDITILRYKDAMDVRWDMSEVAVSLNKIIGRRPQSTVLITFDEQGVSGHPNHVSLYHGCRQYFKTYVNKSNGMRLYTLKSLNIWEKYSFTFLTNVELLVDLVSKISLRVFNVEINVSFFNNIGSNGLSYVKIYSDLNMLSLAYAAMAHGHFSQMVWFRYGWLLFSRYLNYNQLVEIY